MPDAIPAVRSGMTDDRPTLPTVRVLLAAGMLGAGVRAILADAGLDTADDADVVIVDDSWLADPSELAGAPAVVALGGAAWATVLPALSAGGWAVLPVDATPAELVAGTLGAAAGLAVLPPALLGADEDVPDDLPLTASDVSLTPRERDVLILLAEGLSNKRAARDLGVSESTVKFHVQALYSKLGVQSRAGAVARGIALGLVSV